MNWGCNKVLAGPACRTSRGWGGGAAWSLNMEPQWRGCRSRTTWRTACPGRCTSSLRGDKSAKATIRSSVHVNVINRKRSNRSTVVSTILYVRKFLGSILLLYTGYRLFGLFSFVQSVVKNWTVIPVSLIFLPARRSLSPFRHRRCITSTINSYLSVNPDLDTWVWENAPTQSIKYSERT